VHCKSRSTSLAGGFLVIAEGMSIPEELERRKVRLEKLAMARATIEARAKERFEREQAEHQAKIEAGSKDRSHRQKARRQAAAAAGGRPRCQPTRSI
jgi:hypothetical protein